MSCRFIRFVGDSLAAVLQSAQISAFNSARGRRHAADVERARVPLARRYNARWRPEWPSLQRIASTMDLLAILHSHKVARTMWPYIPPSHSYRKEKKKKKNERSNRFTIYQNLLLHRRVLYRFSALEIYSRRSFAPGPVAQRGLRDNRMNDGGSPCWCHFRVVDRDIWGFYGGGSEFATTSRRILLPPPPPPLPPSSLPIVPWSILFSYDDTSPPRGWQRVHARGHAHTMPAAEPIIKRLRGRISARTVQHDVADGVVHVATKAATNARGIASP